MLLTMLPCTLCAMLAAAVPDVDAERRAVIRVGVDAGDVRGADHRALQAAVDYVAGLGGGTVSIGPGRYAMRNALMLRDGVTVRGVPGETVLVAQDAVSSPLVADGDCNQRALTLAQPGPFRVGDGVAVRDDRFGGGFCVTTATLTRRLGDGQFAISHPLYLDYYASKGGKATLAFPVVGGWQVSDAAVEGLTIEGNGERGEWLDGCRGAGVYLFESARVVIRNCTVRHYNGDGISFQVSEDVVVEDCLAEQNLGYGLHPGSGSQRPQVRRNRSLDNGSDGMFVCWHVRHGVFEDNELRRNGRDGISIGHKDSDNVFCRNVIAESARAGVFFRDEDRPMGAHRNVFEDNTIVDNAGMGREKAVIVLLGEHDGVVFRNNKIGNTKSGGAETGAVVGKGARGFVFEGNEFMQLDAEVVEKD